jgi:hypothetical protein
MTREPIRRRACSEGVARLLPLGLVAASLALATTAVGATPSPDPYAASLAYAKCLRTHGVPHPLPDAKGDFSLTPAQEARLRAVPKKTKQAADDACFHYLRGLNLNPLSAKALARARAVVADLGRCISAQGYTVGKPVAQNLTRGRAFFGFDRAAIPHAGTSAGERLTRVEHACEKQVKMDARISKIIDEDRDTGRSGL